jgi:hypothetical protein
MRTPLTGVTRRRGTDRRVLPGCQVLEGIHEPWNP